MALNDVMFKFYRRELGLLANTLTGTFTATGQSTVLTVAGKINVLITGGIGTVAIERSFDGTNWFVISRDTAGTDASYTTATDTAFNGSLEEPEDGVQYRLNCTAYTSGTITYRVSQ